MPNFTESGHAKNTANFEQLITVVTSYGSSYAPSKPELALSNLQNVLQTSKQSLTNVKSSYTDWKNATNDREIAFNPLRSLSTQLVNALIACGAVEQTVNDLKTINRKMQGAHSKLTKADSGKTAANDAATTDNTDGNSDATATPKKVSVSQRSFDSQIEHLEKAIALLSSQSIYSPAETELQVTTLQTKAANLRTLNSTAFTAYTNLVNNRIERNKILYNETTGMLALARSVKAYIKSKFGASSQEYAQVSVIKFVKVVPKIK